METQPRKPKLLLNFFFAFLVIAFAYALDTYHKRLKAEGKAAQVQAVDTVSKASMDTAAIPDTADTASDTTARLPRKK
jgi:hypothetical protein